MNFNEYTDAVLKTELTDEQYVALLESRPAEYIDTVADLVYDTIESGTEIDFFKKLLFYGKEPKESPAIPDIDYNTTLEAFTNNPRFNFRITHALFGMQGEVAELFNAYGKYIQSGEFDVQNVKEELGDMFWYTAVFMHIFGVTMDEVLEANITKLQKRYKTGKFTEEDALNRDTEHELSHISKDTLI